MSGQQLKEATPICTPPTSVVIHSDEKEVAAVDVNGKNGKTTFSLLEDAHSGENSLEPGEVITPPHNTNRLPQSKDVDVSVKKVLCKDTLKKLTQADGEECAAQIRKLLEMDSPICYDNQAQKKSTKNHANKISNVVTPTEMTLNNVEKADDDEDDSEGLYSGSDTSADDELKVQKEAEPYSIHKTNNSAPQFPMAENYPAMGPGHFQGFMRPPRFMGNNFMPRLPRGGMRGGMRPPFFRPPFHLRPYGSAILPMPSQRQHTPPPTRGHSPIRAPRADTLWTHTQPALKWNMKMMPHCPHSKRPGHEKCLKYNEHYATAYKGNEHLAEAKIDREEHAKNHRRSSQSTENDTKKSTLNLNKIHKETCETSQFKVAKGAEKPKKTKNEDPQTVENRKSEPAENNTKKVFDIFAESPPRQRAAPLAPNTKRKEGMLPTKEHSSKASTSSKATVPSSVVPQETKLKPHKSTESDNEAGSTTPPLSQLFSDQQESKRKEKNTAPLLKAIEIQNRIDKLLQDNDLELEELQATKERLLKRTAEHKRKTAVKEKHIKTEKEEFPVINIKVEKIDKGYERQLNQCAYTEQLKMQKVHIKIEPTETEYERKPTRVLETQYDLKLDHDKKQAKQTERTLDRSRESTREKSARRTPSPKHINPFKDHTVLHANNRGSSHARFEKSGNPRSLSGDRIRVTESEMLKRSQSPRRRLHTPPQHLTTHQHARPPMGRQTPTLMQSKPSAYKNDNHTKNARLMFTPKQLEEDVFEAAPSPKLSKEPSPDTDDYIDNWENDDSTTACDSSTPRQAQANNEDDASSSNHLWNAGSTPPPKAPWIKSTTTKSTPPTLNMNRAQVNNVTQPKKPLIDMQEMYNNFLKSIKMNTNSEETPSSSSKTREVNPNQITASSAAETKLKESTVAEANSTTTSSSSSSSSSDDDDSSSEEDDDSESSTVKSSAGQQQIAPPNTQQISTKSKTLKDDNVKGTPKRNTVSKDLKKLKSLEENLARIQMMRENYDSADEICEELLKMESLFLAEKSAILEKYRKTDLKLTKDDTMDTEVKHHDTAAPSFASETNNIFDSNREAIKLTLSPLKLTRKPAIFEREETEAKSTPDGEDKDFTEKLRKPTKEIAIVKPIMDTNAKRHTTSSGENSSIASTATSRHTRERSRTLRSSSRSRSRRSSKSISPRRRSNSRNLISPRRVRYARIRRHSRSRSRSYSRSYSRSRSRSPNRRRRLNFARKRTSFSPPLRPRSPPALGRRSYSRERYSRSPLPFRPPSPPMRRSCSSSPSRRSSRQHSSRSCSPYADYFTANQCQDPGVNAYYYNMPPNQIPLDAHINIIVNGGQDEASNQMTYDSYYPSYVDGGYYTTASAESGTVGFLPNQYIPMQQSYMQPCEAGANDEEQSYYYNDYPAPAILAEDANMTVVGAVASPSLLRELPKAPAVAVQKGNVLEIVPTSEITTAAEVVPDAVAAKPVKSKKREHHAKVPKAQELDKDGKPGKKKVCFEDHVKPNYASDDEDRSIIEKAVARAIKKFQAKKDPEKPAKKSKKPKKNTRVPPPPPPPILPGTKITQPRYKLKGPIIRYWHFDPEMNAMYTSYSRIARPPRLDPNCMPQPKLHTATAAATATATTADAATPASITTTTVKEIIVPSHPPPPLGQLPHPTGVASPVRFFGMNANNSFVRVRHPHHSPVTTPTAQPIPVLGLSYNFPPPRNNVAANYATSFTNPAHVKLLQPPASVDLPLGKPALQHFNVKPIPSISELPTVSTTLRSDTYIATTVKETLSTLTKPTFELSSVATINCVPPTYATTIATVSADLNENATQLTSSSEDDQSSSTPPTPPTNESHTIDPQPEPMLATIPIETSNAIVALTEPLVESS